MNSGTTDDLKNDKNIAPEQNKSQEFSPEKPGEGVDASAENTGDQTSKITFYVSYEGDSTMRFDLDYYMNVHCPLLKDAWDDYGLERSSVYLPADKEAASILIWAGIFKDRATLDAAFKAPLTQKVMEDIKNFTDIVPTRSIGETFKYND
ncbi:EthD family reductase [Pedobacter hartonius]|nr:EthD family reductase [Pedobacter hartonius]